jgi:hypothetical protein
MWRTLLLVAYIAVVGCSKTESEPELKINPEDATKRAADRDKVINQGTKGQ